MKWIISKLKEPLGIAGAVVGVLGSIASIMGLYYIFYPPEVAATTNPPHIFPASDPQEQVLRSSDRGRICGQEMSLIVQSKHEAILQPTDGSPELRFDMRHTMTKTLDDCTIHVKIAQPSLWGGNQSNSATISWSN